MKKSIAMLVILAVLLGGFAALADGADYEGAWACGRAHIDISAEDEGYKVFILWGNSASESAEWSYACLYDEASGSLVDDGMGVMQNVEYAEGGDVVSAETLYSDGAAVFTLTEDGGLIWEDKKEDAGADMVFERAPEPEQKTVAPMPETVDLDEGTYPVAFDREQLSGGVIAGASLFTVDAYDIVDISTLEVGDAILIGGEWVLVESLERGDWLMINGGNPEGGYDLVAFDEDNCWRVSLDDDYPTYTCHGEADLALDDAVTFTDGWDIEKEPATFTGADAVAEAIATSEFEYFDQYNTTVRFEGGKVVEITRVFTP